MNKKGFTLIEIAITVVIIGLLAGFVIVQTQDKEQLFNEVKVKSDLEILKTGIVSYSFDNYNNIPNVSSCVLKEGDANACNFLSDIKPYFQGFPVPDPGIVYKYRYTEEDGCEVFSEGGDINFSYSCSGDEIVEITTYPIAGACGTYHNSDEYYLDELEEYVEGGLCSSGLFDEEGGINEVVGGWSWNCLGQNRGSTSSCVAFVPSNVFACNISDECSISPENSEDEKVKSVHLFSIYDESGSHAEMPNGSTPGYVNKVCCEGTNLESGSSNVVLKLSSVTNAHVEGRGGTKYSNVVYLSSIGKVIDCEYHSGSCGEGFICLASVSDNSDNPTNSHIGNCDAYERKVCCKMSNEVVE